MSARSFLDTNVLIYADDHDTPEKQSIALDLIERCFLRRCGVISTQILQEYFVTVTRKLGVDPAIAKQKVELLSRLDLVVIRLEDILGAIDLHRLHGFSFWDALVIRAAQQSKCSILYTEDLQHGRTMDGLTIVNPFC